MPPPTPELPRVYVAWALTPSFLWSSSYFNTDTIARTGVLVRRLRSRACGLGTTTCRCKPNWRDSPTDRCDRIGMIVAWEQTRAAQAAAERDWEFQGGQRCPVSAGQAGKDLHCEYGKVLRREQTRTWRSRSGCW